MALSITQSKSVHRAGSLNANKRFVQGELPLPVFVADSDSGEINWSDGGKGGRFLFIDGLSVAYQPSNHTQIVTITADSPGGSDSKTLSVFGTFPVYPQKAYQIEEDQDTKSQQARDGTRYFSEQFKPQITWKVGMDRRLSDEQQELWDFLRFHRKVKLFWMYDQEAKIMNKVRRTSAIPAVFESTNSWSTAVVCQGDYAPVVLATLDQTQLRINCGDGLSGLYGADQMFHPGSNIWDFGALADIDTHLLTESPGFDVLRYCRYHSTSVDYDLSGLIPGRDYEITLYFAGPDSLARSMHIYFQGSLVTTVTLAVASPTGIAKEYIDTITADDGGVIALEVEYVSGPNAIINGIKAIAV